MRILPWSAILMAAFAPAAFAQIGNIPGTGYTGAPYSAVETEQYHGNTMTILIARDTEGRTRQEYISHDGNGLEVHSIRVFDPTIGGTLMWKVGGSDAPHIVSVSLLAPKQRGTAPVPHHSELVAGKKPCGSGCNVESLPPPSNQRVYVPGIPRQTHGTRSFEQKPVNSNNGKLDVPGTWNHSEAH